MSEEQQIMQSKHTQQYSAEGKTVDIDIYRTEDSSWILEIVDQDNNSTLWEDQFEQEDDALAEALDALKEEGIGSFIGAAE
ncbi:hypothetical protein [Idiomarina seosinensis]|uniref:Uncharacterized protein n=1 Tax=Idiomarina seosinensis TaxID=281739 RepID=A0A432ZIL7_9GAMM|nr:hypothetical protein [Idiomarina seosinensis]RUO77857.1 hypothetical protein CWI81_05080 [Idiomarina seosinensis]